MLLTLMKRVLPYVAVFLLGSVAAVFATAEPPKCDWAFREDYPWIMPVLMALQPPRRH